MGQTCCSGGGEACQTGLACSTSGGFNAPSMCQPCGGMDQACCGTGPVAMRTCTGGLMCRTSSRNNGTRCVTMGSGGDGGPGPVVPDAGGQD
jgi:hypothetical protein